jgi:tRNA-splicing ligase RtcB
MERLDHRIVLFLPSSTIEPEALIQIRNISALPFIFKHVAVMPDCHVGKGATVGTVIATREAVIPAAVGVDIGCGMIAVKTPLTRADLPELQAIRQGIERRIPMSAGKFNTKVSASARPRIDELRTLASGRDLNKEFGTKSWELELGTLGGGNHFIEVCLDETEHVWLTLHSGSRGIEEMMDRVLMEMSYATGRHGVVDFEEDRINCHHNFTQIETHFGEPVWVTRKGAIEARKGQKALIPGSMGTRSYIVSGLEHPMAFRSAPHGAGRRLSRSKAKQQFTLSDLKQSMEGIEFNAKPECIDEIPGAYKDIDQVMANAKELVEVEHTLRQVVNVKGD